jgi:hypothetical protein
MEVQLHTFSILGTRWRLVVNFVPQNQFSPHIQKLSYIPILPEFRETNVLTQNLMGILVCKIRQGLNAEYYLFERHTK